MDLLEQLNQYRNTMLPMHMPGHKRNTELAPYLSELLASCDITEASGFDNLHSAHGILKEGMEQAATLWGSKRAFWLVNGSTCGILSGIKASVPIGGKVICARNCHKSVYNALSLIRAVPVFLMPETEAETGTFGPLKPDNVAAALEENPDAKLVILTSPTYEGVISDISGICRAAHAKGIPVLVDEAHGAHLGFGYGFPEGAIHAGADLVVQSLHKTLPSLTQTALLHINGNIVDERKVENALSVFETSSPSYLLMASISGCINLLETRTPELFSAWHENIRQFMHKTKDLKKLSLMSGLWLRDPSKIIIQTDHIGMTGAELADILRRNYHIEPEMAAGNYVVAMTGMGDTPETMDALANALLELDACLNLSEPASFPPPVLPERAMLPHEAEAVPKMIIKLSEAEGCISAETVWAYPPGIPLVIPGEKLTEQVLSLMQEYLSLGIPLESTMGNMPKNIYVLQQRH
ncbi:MAG: PLP-dependent transferase [Bacillota bacterium]|nr:PLP-dependent transferase [Bacillota bacterium]